MLGDGGLFFDAELDRVAAPPAGKSTNFWDPPAEHKRSLWVRGPGPDVSRATRRPAPRRSCLGLIALQPLNFEEVRACQGSGPGADQDPGPGRGDGGEELGSGKVAVPSQLCCGNTDEFLAGMVRTGRAGSNTAIDHVEVLTQTIA